MDVTVTASNADRSSPASSKSTTEQVITGPEERLYLSFDVLPASVKQLKYDDATKSIAEKTKSEHGYLGIDYQVGDILTKYPSWDTNNIAAKLMISASKKPFSSVGFGVGYNFKRDILGTGTEIPFAAFVGFFNTSGDGRQASRKSSVRLGLSYNIGVQVAGSASETQAKPPEKK